MVYKENGDRVLSTHSGTSEMRSISRSYGDYFRNANLEERSRIVEHFRTGRNIRELRSNRS